MIGISTITRVLLSNVALLMKKVSGTRVNYKIKSLISPNASLRTYDKGRIIIGEKNEIRPNTEITARAGLVRIGDNCFINRNCMVVAHGKIEIGQKVTIGPGTCIYDHDHDRNGGYDVSNIIIEDNVWIGAGCTILKGVRVGENSIIGAGTVISKDIPADVMVIQKKQTTIITNI